MDPKVATIRTADLWPRCEFGKTPSAEEDCPRPGEVRLDGGLFCMRHAKLIRLRSREDKLLAALVKMDKWLDDTDNRADRFRWRRVLRNRDEAVEQLRFNRTLIEAHE